MFDNINFYLNADGAISFSAEKREMSKQETVYNFRDGNGPVPAHRHINPDGRIGSIGGCCFDMLYWKKRSSVWKRKSLWKC